MAVRSIRQGECLRDDLTKIFRRPEDIDHVDRFRNVCHGRINGLAEDLLAGLPRIDRVDRVAL